MIDPASVMDAHLCRTAASLRWVVGLSLALAATLALGAEPPRNVLVLYSENRLLPGFAITDDTLDKVLKAEYGYQVELFNDLLALDGPRAAGYDDNLISFLRTKYAQTRIDAIVAVRGPALKLLLQRRDHFLPGVPVVHVGISTQELAGIELPRDVIGVPVKLEPEKTIELALRLHPGARRVVAITGMSEIDREWESLLRRAFKPLEGRIAVEFWVAMPLAEILARVRQLPADAIVYVPGLRQDGTGKRLVPRDVAAQIVTVSPVPVYGHNSNFPQVGSMGGYIVPVEEIARPAGKLVARLLRGEKPEALNAPSAIPNAYILNMHQLHRFGFDQSAIPPGAILRFRPPSLWEQHKLLILAGTAIVLF